MSSPSAEVLLIEDNPGDADLIRLRLVEADATLQIACVDRLSAGLNLLAQRLPAVVLLDLNLPDSQGAGTFRKILRSAPSVPVIVLSGLEDQELAARAVHQGVQDYLVKGDFNSKQLARAMRYAIERQSLLTSLEMSRKQQLQFKDEFLSHVSHELRTPLASIYQFITILLDGLAGDVLPEQRDHLGTVLRSVNQLRAMIGDLLEATRAESGKLYVEARRIRLGEVIEQAADMLRGLAAEKQIRLEIALDPNLSWIYAERERVLQILINLIDNGVKFTPVGGTVTIKAGLVETDPDFVYISVADTGRGISPQAKQLIFERLFQDPGAADNSRKGLGLGLYIVHELVRLHGGRIWVESQLGSGATFSFTLPIFSASKLLFPAITAQGLLREAISVATITVTPLQRGMDNWRMTQRRCLEILQRCIMPDKDVLLSGLEDSPLGETYVIVASTDREGIEVVLARVREQLGSSAELKAAATFKASAVELQLPATREGMPLSKLVQQVANSVNRIIDAALASEKFEASSPSPVRTTVVCRDNNRPVNKD